MKFSTFAKKRTSAYLMMEALVYIGVSFLLLGIGFAAFYHAIDGSVALKRNAEDVTKALNVGERWRADVRAASLPVDFKSGPSEQVLRLPGSKHQIVYRFANEAVLRRVDSGP